MSTASSSPSSSCDLGQRRARDGADPDSRELALAQLGEHLVGLVGHHERDHGVAQELEALVRAQGLGLLHAGVREGAAEQVGVGEGVPGDLLGEPEALVLGEARRLGLSVSPLRHG